MKTSWGRAVVPVLLALSATLPLTWSGSLGRRVHRLWARLVGRTPGPFAEPEVGQSDAPLPSEVQPSSGDGSRTSGSDGVRANPPDPEDLEEPDLWGVQSFPASDPPPTGTGREPS